MVNMETNSRERRIIDDVLQRDKVFRYKLLGRLQSDCEYYLNYGNRNTGRLWAGSVNLQIKLMVDFITVSMRNRNGLQWMKSSHTARKWRNKNETVNYQITF